MDLYMPPPLPLQTRATPVASEGTGFRTGQGGAQAVGDRGPRHLAGVSLEPGLRTAPAESCVLGPGRGAGRLPASPGLSGAARPRCPKRAPSSEPRPRPKPLPRSEMPAGEGRPEPRARLPLSLWIPLIRRLYAAPRLQGCQGRPAGVLETVPSLSPFIKRPGAALKPRSQ